MKKSIKVLLVAICTILLVACGGDSGGGSSANKTWTISVSTAHHNTTSMAKGLAWFTEELPVRTDGRIKVNTFYANSYGAQKDVFMMMATDEVEIIMDGSVTIDFYAPEYGFLTAPYLIDSSEHLLNVLESPVAAGFKAKLKDNNILMEGIAIRGLRNTLANVKINSLAEANKLVIRMPDNATYLEAWGNINASCQVMGGAEMYSAMSTGVINAVEGPYEQFVSEKLNEVGKFLYPTEHTVEFMALYVNARWFESLPSDLQTIVRDTCIEAMERASAMSLEQDEANKQIVIDSGAEFVQIDNQYGFDKLRSVWEKKFTDGVWTSSYDEIMSYK